MKARVIGGDHTELIGEVLGITYVSPYSRYYNKGWRYNSCNGSGTYGLYLFKEEHLNFNLRDEWVVRVDNEARTVSENCALNPDSTCGRWVGTYDLRQCYYCKESKHGGDPKLYWQKESNMLNDKIINRAYPDINNSDAIDIRENASRIWEGLLITLLIDKKKQVMDIVTEINAEKEDKCSKE